MAEMEQGKGTPGANGRSAGAARARRFKVFAGLLTVAAVATALYWFVRRDHETTDDAFIDGTVVNISPQVGGRVVAVDFTDNQKVVKGQVLVRIDPRDFQAALAAAQANLDAARANRQAAEAALSLTRVTAGAGYTGASSALSAARVRVAQAGHAAVAAQANAVRAEADAKRYRRLYRTGDASRQKLDQAEADAKATRAQWRAAQSAVADAKAQVAEAQATVEGASTAAQQVAVKEAGLAQAQAQVEQAKADLQTARLNLSYTTVEAPQSGRVSKKDVSVGDLVQKGQILTRMVAGRPWVVGNYKETEVTRMRPGDPVTISVDAYPDITLTGKVASLQPATGARFSLLPPENATGNFVKVVQRVPIKIVLDPPRPGHPAPFLVLGMSVVPDVTVGSK
jgi:membrane fusion protein (multidrug efflux system)